MKILLIDDDVNLCYLTSLALTKSGHAVAMAHDVPEGITQALANRPDVILMDVMLPGTSGVEAVKKLKGIDELRDVPVIFLTALVTEGENGPHDMVLKADGMDYPMLGKPFEIRELLATIEKAT